jgi:hypothetical protein
VGDGGEWAPLIGSAAGGGWLFAWTLAKVDLSWSVVELGKMHLCAPPLFFRLYVQTCIRPKYYWDIKVLAELGYLVQKLVHAL